MAHKSLDRTLRDIKIQQEWRDAIIVWRKDWERWEQDMRRTVDDNLYFVLEYPKWITKNQLIIAERKKPIKSLSG